MFVVSRVTESLYTLSDLEPVKPVFLNQGGIKYSELPERLEWRNKANCTFVINKLDLLRNQISTFQQANDFFKPALEDANSRHCFVAAKPKQVSFHLFSCHSSIVQLFTAPMASV